jgi:hypothetical protein
MIFISKTPLEIWNNVRGRFYSLTVSQRKFLCAVDSWLKTRLEKRDAFRRTAAAKINEDTQTSLLRYFVYIFS